MKPRQKRMMFVGLGLAGLVVATALILNAFQGNLVFFYSPSDVLTQAPADRAFRLGGMVLDGSVQREDDGLTVHFVVTDHAQSIPVVYSGILPDLFREGQGVVTQGRLGEDGRFYADQVLAKHDEEYMPPEVADALERAGTAAAGGGAATTGL